MALNLGCISPVTVQGLRIGVHLCGGREGEEKILPKLEAEELKI